MDRARYGGAPAALRRGTAATGRRQAGVNLMETILVLAIIGVIVGGAIALFDTGLGTANRKAALEEIQLVKAAAGAFRRAPARNGLYTGISVTVLDTQGYGVGQFTTGTNQNVYGLTVAVAPAGTPTGSDAELTYGFETAAACNQMVEQFTGVEGVKGTPACAAAAGVQTLTLTLE